MWFFSQLCLRFTPLSCRVYLKSIFESFSTIYIGMMAFSYPIDTCCRCLMAYPASIYRFRSGTLWILTNFGPSAVGTFKSVGSIERRGSERVWLLLSVDLEILWLAQVARCLEDSTAICHGLILSWRQMEGKAQHIRCFHQQLCMVLLGVGAYSIHALLYSILQYTWYTCIYDHESYMYTYIRIRTCMINHMKACNLQLFGALR